MAEIQVVPNNMLAKSLSMNSDRGRYEAQFQWCFSIVPPHVNMVKFTTRHNFIKIVSTLSFLTYNFPYFFSLSLNPVTQI